MTNDDYKNLYVKPKNKNLYLELSNRAIGEIDNFLLKSAIKGKRKVMLELLPYKLKYRMKFDLFMEVLKAHYIKQGFDAKVDSALLIISMQDPPTPHPNEKIGQSKTEISTEISSEKEKQKEE